jgi:uncharacterized protein YoaH (UPF0181 family)
VTKKKGRPRATRRAPLAPPDGLRAGQASLWLRKPNAHQGEDTDRVYDELFSMFGMPVTVTPPGGPPVQTEAIPRPIPGGAHLDLPDAMIAAREHIYTKTRDSLRALEAYWIARRAHRAIPDWVAAYFERFAFAMIAFSRQQPTGRKRAAAIARALELNSRARGALSAKRATLRRQQQYAVDVLEIMAKGYTESAAIAHVAEIHRVGERRTVERAVDQVRQRGWLVPGDSWTETPLPSAAARKIKPL